MTPTNAKMPAIVLILHRAMLLLLCEIARLFVRLRLSVRRREVLGLCRQDGQEYLVVLVLARLGVLAGQWLGVSPRIVLGRPLRSCKRVRASYVPVCLWFWVECLPIGLLGLGLNGQSGLPCCLFSSRVENN
jgi:hypothetical protein